MTKYDAWPALEEREQRHEGFRARRYRDIYGRWTIGWGRCLDTNPLQLDEIAYLRRGDFADRDVSPENLCLSQDEALWLLRNVNRIFAAELAAALPWFEYLDQERQGVLIEMAYQIGVHGLLGFHRTLGAIEAGAYAEAAGHLVDEHRDFAMAEGGMLASAWASETPARAKELAQLMAEGAPALTAPSAEGGKTTSPAAAASA